MNEGRTVFAQLMELVPHHQFRRCVERYRGNARVRRFRCWDQFLCMAFGQLTYRESLRNLHLRARRHPEETPRHRAQPLHNPTDPERQRIRENRAFTSIQLRDSLARR